MIRRCEHSALKNFTVVRRKLAQDKRLSFQARGMLLYILSKSEGWEAQDRDIMKEGGIKKHAYTSILNELKEHGYAKRVEKRKKRGRFDYDLEIYEEPQVTGDSPLPDYPIAAEPSADSPIADNHTAAIDSTCAGAPPLTDLKEITKQTVGIVGGLKKPRQPDSDDARNEKLTPYHYNDLKDPAAFGYDITIAMAGLVPPLTAREVKDLYPQWWGSRVVNRGIGKPRPRQKSVLPEYAQDLQNWLEIVVKNRKTNGNGYSSGAKAGSDRPSWMAPEK